MDRKSYLLNRVSKKWQKYRCIIDFARSLSADLSKKKKLKTIYIKGVPCYMFCQNMTLRPFKVAHAPSNGASKHVSLSMHRERALSSFTASVTVVCVKFSSLYGKEAQIDQQQHLGPLNAHNHHPIKTCFFASCTPTQRTQWF